MMHWRSKAVTTSLSKVPSTPGLYAYGHETKSLHGLAGGRLYVYIGESDNLKRRLEQHLPANEQNPRLQQYLRENRSIAKCWYCAMSDIPGSERKRLEEELIKFFAPQFNIRGR